MTRSLATLTAEEVLRIHEILIADFARSQDPIFPPGVRSLALLESAVGRQLSGHAGWLKYADAIGNAATLVFGVCCDHPFHNGNKRTALVAMLAHLDRNDLCLYRTTKTELYQFMISIADHSIGLRLDPRRPDKVPGRRSADEEVAAIDGWLRRRVEKIRRGEKPISYRNLRQALTPLGFELGTIDSNSIEVLKVTVEKPTLLHRQASHRSEANGLDWLPQRGYRGVNQGSEGGAAHV